MTQTSGNCRVEVFRDLFRNDDDATAAEGHFVHVYVERESRKATALPPEIQTALERILSKS